METSCPVGAREVATSDCYLHYDREANSSVQGGAACLGTRPGSWFLTSQRDMINQSLLWVGHGSLLWVAVPSTTAEKVFMCDGGTLEPKYPHGETVQNNCLREFVSYGKNHHLYCL